MSAKTAPALRPEEDPVTPVIIKSGGGGDEDEYGHLAEPSFVHIKSSSVPFKETVTGTTWVSSQSTSSGRITGVEIKDDATTTFHRIDPSAVLASISIKFGSAQFIAMESGIAANNEVVLLLTSPEVSFQVAEVKETGDWHSSSAPFREKMSSVLVMVGGEQRLSYQCKHQDAEVSIMFEQV
jgi:hypothetical protein